MTLVELHVDLARVANALDRIAELLEKLAIPPIPADIKVHQATLDDLHTVSEADLIRMQAEQLAFAERYRVAPNSPAMSEALRDWEEQQRSIHGEGWQPPEDWKAIYAAAGGGAVRERAGAPSAARGGS